MFTPYNSGCGALDRRGACGAVELRDPRQERVRLERGGERVALYLVAAHVGQHRDRVRRLDALGNDAQAELADQRDHRRDDRLAAPVVGAERIDERLVDLDDVRRQRLEIGEAAVSGAEIVDRNPDARRRQRLEPGEREHGILHHRGFGHFEFEHRRRDRVARKRGGDLLDEIVVLQIGGCDIDRQRQHESFLTPVEMLAQRGFEDERGGRLCQRGALDHRDELARRHLAELRMPPPQQRFHAHAPASGKVDPRLIDQPHLPAGLQRGTVRQKQRDVARLFSLPLAGPREDADEPRRRLRILCGAMPGAQQFLRPHRAERYRTMPAAVVVTYRASEVVRDVSSPAATTLI